MADDRFPLRDPREKDCYPPQIHDHFSAHEAMGIDPYSQRKNIGNDENGNPIFKRKTYDMNAGNRLDAALRRIAIEWEEEKKREKCQK